MAPKTPFSKKTDSTEQQDPVDRLTDKVAELAEAKGEAQANARRLEQDLKAQEDATRRAEQATREVQADLDKVCEAIDTLGLNADRLKTQDPVWGGRNLELLGTVLRPTLESLKIPSLDEATEIPDLSDFLYKMPGFSPVANSQPEETRKHYGFVQLGALSLIRNHRSLERPGTEEPE